VADEPSSTRQPDETPAAETVLNGCTASENGSAEEQSAVVNGRDVGMDVTEDAEIKVSCTGLIISVTCGLGLRVIDVKM